MHDMQQQHEMCLENTYRSGAEEWFCPTCGRRFIMYLPPGCETLALERGNKHVLVWANKVSTMVAIKMVLDPGDEYTIHSGKTLRTAFPEVRQVDEAMSAANQNPWLEWLEDIDFGGWDNGDPDHVV